MSSAERSARLELAVAAARRAGDLTLQYFQRADLGVEIKSDDSPVTVADRAAEQLLRKEIAAAFPDDAILGEEFGEQPGTSGYRWILDPIDGTKSFISGVPLYGTLIGVEHEGRSVVGVIHIPGLHETAYAAAGQGAWYLRGDAKPVRAHVSQKPSLGEGLFCTSESRNFERIGRFDAYVKLQNSARIARSWGDAYGYLLVAVGRAEVMVDPMMHVWDCAALQPVIEEAGGTFTDWNGTPTIHATNSIATNGKVLDEVLAITRGA
ncbi:MAG: histidinol-phosphatase [Planctomycetaceae bacterium]|nr:histidinol-phosphatase [Planctomycetaceae bacterium]